MGSGGQCLKHGQGVESESGRPLHLSVPHPTTCHWLIFCVFILIFISPGDAFKAFKDAGDTENMLAKAEKCKKLAAHLRRAETSRKLLHRECALSGHNPNAIPVANDTRWGSSTTSHACSSWVSKAISGSRIQRAGLSTSSLRSTTS